MNPLSAVERTVVYAFMVIDATALVTCASLYARGWARLTHAPRPLIDDPAALGYELHLSMAGFAILLVLITALPQTLYSVFGLGSAQMPRRKLAAFNAVSLAILFIVTVATPIFAWTFD